MYKYDIYIFKPDSLIGKIITVVTKSEYSHSAIMIDGVLYDSSESRGDFNVSDVNIIKRKYIRYTVKSIKPLNEWVNVHMGRKYDWVGVLGWMLKANNKNQFYCFEATYDAMIEMGVAFPPIPKQLDADDLVNILDRSDMTVEKFEVK